MKCNKKAGLALLTAVVVCVSGCTVAEKTPVEKTPVGKISTEETTAEVNPVEENINIPVDDNGIDVDLTALSSTMVYAEVYNMMVNPEAYIGKTVKMDGMFVPLHDENTGMDYYACVIQDATACCAQGIEFEATEEYRYPDDYPEDGGEICVVGTFDTYKEGDNTYCTLKNATID